MATHQIPIIGPGSLPASADVFFEPSNVKDTNDRFPQLVLIFNDTATKIGIRGRFRVPQNYVGTPRLVVSWKTTATTGNAVWDFDAKPIAAGESLDPSTDDETATQTTAAAGTTNLRVDTVITLTGTYAAGDDVEFTLSRDGASSDTIAAALAVYGAYFQYADA